MTSKTALKRQAFACMASLLRGAIEGGQLGSYGDANGLTDDEIVEIETTIRQEAEKMYNRSLTPAQKRAENADYESDWSTNICISRGRIAQCHIDEMKP